jgi:hypothetical protein
MSTGARRQMGTEPFRPEQLRSGDPYEIANGHAVFCAPTGGDGGGPIGWGFQVIDSDPKVKSAGVDTGFQLSPLTMRAPDVAARRGAETRCARPSW